MTSRRPLTWILAAALFLAVPAPGFAAPPPAAFQPVVSEGFEGAYPERLSVVPIHPDSQDSSPTSAYWGPVTARSYGGSRGLWCAGASATSTILPDTWDAYGGKYPAASRGLARISVPELEHYYSSRLTFRYTMPSLGFGDVNSFNVGWGALGTDRFYTNEGIAKTPANEWKSLSWDLSDPLNDPSPPEVRGNLSRRPGLVSFQWWDFNDHPADVGEGVTIDDVAVTGLKYGPVRDLAAVQSGSTIVLSWAEPYRSNREAVVDERTVTYRVWRSSAGEDSWAEISPLPERVSETTFTDTTARSNAPYDYLVQAWDPVPGASYGVLAPSVRGKVDSTQQNPGLSVSVSASKTSVKAGETVTFTYGVVNTGEAPLTSVRLETGELFGTITRSTALEPEQTWTVTKDKALGASVTAGASAYGTFDGSQYSASAAAVNVSVTAPPSRIAGDDRMKTAVAVSQQAFPDAASLGPGKAVVIASAFGWADALPASSLAGAVGGPLLLVGKDQVPSPVAGELKRLKGLGVTKAYVVGGDPVVGSQARAQLKSILGTTPVRVEGSDRYGTSYAVSEQTRKLRASGPTGGTAFVATGLNFPDALAASSLAAALRGPIVLTQTQALPSATLKALANLKPDRIVICGGDPAVGPRVESDLKKVYGGKVVRKAGPNRYDTARALIDHGKTLTGVPAPVGIFLATGTNYPDALAGGVLAGIGTGPWAPLMLTDPARLSPQAVSFIKANPSLGFASVLGGTPAVSDGVRKTAVGLVR
ncbi:MAG: cell wall-binding repeat-containing protein [Coriobacteriia bacterium]|nr:cell wall-binding repeat-containing protein [Coriobacteriia bacterium]